MKEEIKKVLELVEQGKISPEDGKKLIEAIQLRYEKIQSKSASGKILRIYIKDEKDELNLRIPLPLAKLFIKLIPNLNPEDRQVIDNYLQHPETFLDITSENGKEKLKIWIE